MPLMQKLASGAQKLGLELTTQQLDQFQAYYDELTDWNRRMNLTAITDYAEVQIKHFLDALTVVLVLEKPLTDSIRVLDVGTGAGIPGVPLKIVFPEIRLALLDATAKKADFLQYLTQHLRLSDVEVVVGRAEEVAHDERYREQFDLVLSRAVARLPALTELTLPFCVVGGWFIAMKKGKIDPEVRQAGRAIELLGGVLHGVVKVELPEFDDERCLIVVDKLSPTPRQYPRRPGIPEKRPLR